MHPGGAGQGKVRQRRNVQPTLEGGVCQAEMGKGAFLAEVQQEQKPRGTQTLGPAEQGEQSHVASSPVGVRGKQLEMGLERYLWAHFWRPVDALSRK